MKITVVISEIETGDGENFVELTLDQSRTLWEQLGKVFSKPLSWHPFQIAPTDIRGDHGGLCACPQCVPASL